MRRVCGLDVHKDSVFACILDENEKIICQNKFGVLTPELERLVKVLSDNEVEEVAMESTSIYWIPIWRILEPYFSLKLVNPYFIKQLPGKKSDVKDAEWIAVCLLKGLLAGSYVPEEQIQQLRQYDRRIFDLNREIVRKQTKLDAALQRCNIRISNYVSSIDSKSYMKVVDQIVQGVTDPVTLAGHIHKRTVNRCGWDTIVASLAGVVSEVDTDVIRQLRDEILLAKKHREECLSKMLETCQRCFPEQLDNLQTIPGVSLRSATAIIAELGVDISSFEDAAHLVSWCGLKPRNEESAGKIRSRKITHGNKYLRVTLCECAWAASRTQGCFFNEFSYRQTVVRRKNALKVNVAIARKLLTAVWFILSYNMPYMDYSKDIPSDR